MILGLTLLNLADARAQREIIVDFTTAPVSAEDSNLLISLRRCSASLWRTLLVGIGYVLRYPRASCTARACSAVACELIVRRTRKCEDPYVGVPNLVG